MVHMTLPIFYYTTDNGGSWHMLDTDEGIYVFIGVAPTCLCGESLGVNGEAEAARPSVHFMRNGDHYVACDICNQEYSIFTQPEVR